MSAAPLVLVAVMAGAAVPDDTEAVVVELRLDFVADEAEDGCERVPWPDTVEVLVGDNDGGSTGVEFRDRSGVRLGSGGVEAGEPVVVRATGAAGDLVLRDGRGVLTGLVDGADCGFDVTVASGWDRLVEAATSEPDAGSGLGLGLVVGLAVVVPALALSGVLMMRGRSVRRTRRARRPRRERGVVDREAVSNADVEQGSEAGEFIDMAWAYLERWDSPVNRDRVGALPWVSPVERPAGSDDAVRALLAEHQAAGELEGGAGDRWLKLGATCVAAAEPDGGLAFAVACQRAMRGRRRSITNEGQASLVGRLGVGFSPAASSAKGRSSDAASVSLASALAVAAELGIEPNPYSPLASVGSGSALDRGDRPSGAAIEALAHPDWVIDVEGEAESGRLSFAVAVADVDGVVHWPRALLGEDGGWRVDPHVTADAIVDQVVEHLDAVSVVPVVPTLLRVDAAHMSRIAALADARTLDGDASFSSGAAELEARASTPRPGGVSAALAALTRMPRLRGDWQPDPQARSFARWLTSPRAHLSIALTDVAGGSGPRSSGFTFVRTEEHVWVVAIAGAWGPSGVLESQPTVVAAVGRGDIERLVRGLLGE